MTAENALRRRLDDEEARPRFNEAAADDRGKRTVPSPGADTFAAGFNEAAADDRGKRSWVVALLGWPRRLQ